ncbi:MAG: choice-of-anchor L domain-containing protein, partial [Hyphomonas sp.]|nr:choice-of-anchor L domain-containing protein [Hyphomonas sp.]
SGDGTPPGANTESDYSVSNNQPGDAQLSAFAKVAFPGAGDTQDASVLQFSFTAGPGVGTLLLDVIFASDEFPEFSNTRFVDIAAVTINGVNYAYFNGNTQQPLSVIGSNLAAGNFVNNTGGQIPIEYDGISSRLTIALPVQSGVNTVRIGVADTGDSIYDSAIFVSNLRTSQLNPAGTYLSTRIANASAANFVLGKTGFIAEIFELETGNDVAIAGGGGDFIDGGAGDDALFGEDGDDLLFGDSGNDALHGGAGNDRLIGGTFGDYLDGGDGYDVADYSYETTGITIDMAFGGNADAALGDTLVSIEGISGTGFSDSIRGDELAQVFVGGDGFDILDGRGGNDQLFGGAGNDQLFGGGGQDDLIGGLGADLMNGGDGFDTASYSQEAAAIVDLVFQGGNSGSALGDLLFLIEQIVGSNGDDVLRGTNDGEVLIGGNGNDLLDGRGGADYLIGGIGTDQMFGGAGTDTFVTGLGADIVNGGDDFDMVSYAGALAEIIVALDGSRASQGSDAQGDLFNGVEGVEGTAFADQLRGTTGFNILLGLAGNDFFEGLGGADFIDGGAGIDTVAFTGVNTGVLVDTAFGGNGGGAAGASFISIESVIGTSAADTVRGGEGADTFSGGAGGDILDGRGGADLLEGGDGADQLFGGAGNDALVGGAGADLLNGGDGFDTVSYSTSGLAVIVDALFNGGNTNDAAGDVLLNIEQIVGSIFGDTVRGTSVDNILIGLGGADILDARGGADQLFGGDGADQLFGGDDNDNLIGGAGADLLNGGAGADFAIYSSAFSGVSLALDGSLAGQGEAAGDTFVEVEHVIGSANADTIRGDAQANWIYGEQGNDRIEGMIGADVLFGDAGDDVMIGGAGGDFLDGGFGFDTADYSGSASAVQIDLQFSSGNLGGDAQGDFIFNIERVIGTSGNDVLRGGFGGEQLRGGLGADVLDGRDGSDTLEGGAGSDDLWGGAGADRFLFSVPTDGPDRLWDFAAEDRIQFDDGAFNLFGSPVSRFQSAENALLFSATGASLSFQTATGALWYDPDGTSGSGGAILVAVVQSGHRLSAAQIEFI